MSNLIDYLEKVKELTFDQEPLNILKRLRNLPLIKSL